MTSTLLGGPWPCSSLCANLTHLEGQGDLVSRLVLGIIRVTIWVIKVMNLLTKSP